MTLSRRTATVVVVVLAVVVVGLFVIRALIPGFGDVEGRHDVVALGQPITALVDRAEQTSATFRVTEVALVSAEQRERWELRPTLPVVTENDALDDSDIYLVRFSVVGSPLMVTSDWRLVDDNGEVYPAGFISTSPEADCESTDCAVVAVPHGTAITMVRFYGVALDRRILVGENWAGWTIT